jgi:hypothetical protein
MKNSGTEAMYRTGIQEALDHAAVRIGRARVQHEYYHPASESAENPALMRAFDEQYLRTLVYGSRRMAVVLGANRNRIQLLMRVMGIELIYLAKRTTWREAQ